jgi:hypothetical protein
MHIKGKHAQHIKIIFNFILNEKIKLKHGLLWDYIDLFRMNLLIAQ